MATTLIEVWKKELAVHAAALAAATSRIAGLQDSVATARKQLDEDAAALKKLTADISANRKKLVDASVPSEVAQLNATIRDQMIEQRRLQGVILDNQEAAAMATARLDAGTLAMARAREGAATSKAAIEAATKSGEQRDKRRKAAADPPLKTLKADATAFSTGPVAADAQAVMNGNIPAELLDLLVNRHATRKSRAAMIATSLAKAEVARAEALGAISGTGGTVAEKELAFSRADTKLSEYVETAIRNYDRVVTLFKELQKIKLDPAKNPDILTAAQKVDAKVSPTRAAAAQKSLGVDGQLDAVIDAENDLDTGLLASIDADVDAVATDPAVKALQDAVTVAEKAYNDGRKALTTNGDRKLLDEWEIVVPDAIWQRYVEYVDAMGVLAELKSTDAASLVTELDTAEEEYALALAKAAKARRRADAYSGEVDLRAKRAEISSASMPARLFSAVRGDSY